MGEKAPAVVVVGASAGGVEALTTLAGRLPADLDAAICVVLHLPAGADSRLARIMSRAGPLPAVQARGGEQLTSGCVYVAPPDRHLIVRDGHVLVERGPHENGLRPSIDVLFRSAALSYGRRAVAVVLSGTRNDGVAGASAVGARGGCVFVQSPDDALFPGMPAETVSPRPSRPRRAAPPARGGDRRGSPAPFGGGPDEREWTRRDEPRDRVRNARRRGARARRPARRVVGVLLPRLRRSPLGAGGSRSGPLPVSRRPRLFGRRGRRGAGRVGRDGPLDCAASAAGAVAAHRGRLAARMGDRGAERSRERFEALAEEAREQAEVIRRLLVGADAADG